MVWTLACFQPLMVARPPSTQLQESREATLCDTWDTSVSHAPGPVWLHTVDEVAHCNHPFHSFGPVSERDT